MAIQTRRYRCVGLTASFITRYVAPAGVSSSADNDLFVTLTYDDSLVEVVDLDQAMSARGCVPDDVTLSATPMKIAGGTKTVASGATETVLFSAPVNNALSLYTTTGSASPVNFGAGLDVDAILQFAGPLATDWAVVITNNTPGSLDVKWAVTALEIA